MTVSFFEASRINSLVEYLGLQDGNWFDSSIHEASNEGMAAWKDTHQKLARVSGQRGANCKSKDDDARRFRAGIESGPFPQFEYTER